MKNLLLCGLLAGGVATAEPLSHSNNTGLAPSNCHGCNPSWIEAVGLLFPDVALVLGSGDSDFEFSLDCDPSSVAQNHFAMFWALLSLAFQQHEAGCWAAYDDTVAVCMARSAVCGTQGEEIWAGVGQDSWEGQCIAAAAYEREFCKDGF